MIKHLFVHLNVTTSFVLGSDPILTNYYKNRLDAVEKCAHVAKSRGYQVFTIQNGGFCSSGPMAHRTFQIYGPASNCKSGTGGKWASDVYIFNGKQQYYCISLEQSKVVNWVATK